MASVREVIEAVDHDPFQVYINDGRLVAAYSGGWIRAMEAPGGDILVGVACQDAGAAVRCLKVLLKEAGVAGL